MKESVSLDLPAQPDEIEIPFSVVPDDTEEMLSSKEVFDYRKTHEAFARWLLLKGKDTTHMEGYSEQTVKRTLYRVGYFERWAWTQADEYIPVPSLDHADDFIEALAYTDYSNSHKHATMHSIKRYFKWRKNEHGEDLWEPDRSFNISNGQQPQDYLTKRERQLIRHEALSYGSFLSYHAVKGQPERRKRAKRYVADQLDKPIDWVTTEDWDAVESWKFTSMVWTSLDAGLRPIEVERAKPSWVDVDNAVLRIPKEESSKNDSNWTVSLTEKTAEALGRWLEERSHRVKYDDTDALWLTRMENPYESRQLRRLLLTLSENAGMETDNRKISWYSVRHSVGTYMTREEDLAATKEQLRHKRPETTMKYDAAPSEDRREALDKMG